MSALVLSVLLAGSSLLAAFPLAAAVISIDDVQRPTGSATISNPYLPMDANISGAESTMVAVDSSAEWLTGTFVDGATVVGTGGTLQLRRIDRDDFNGGPGVDSVVWDTGDNFLVAGGTLSLSSDTASGVDRPFVRMSAAQGGLDLRTYTNLVAETTAAFNTPSLSTDAYGIGFSDGGGAFFGVRLAENGSGFGGEYIEFYSCVNFYTCTSGGVRVDASLGNPEQLRAEVTDGSTGQITGSWFDGGSGTWIPLGTLSVNFTNYPGPWRVFSGRMTSVSFGEDFTLDVDYIALNTVLYIDSGDYVSAPINTGMLPGVMLDSINITTTTGALFGVYGAEVASAPNDTGPYTTFTPVAFNASLGMAVNTWVQFTIRLTRSATPAWPDAVTMSLSYKTEVGAFWFDDFPDGPSGVINPDSWTVSDGATLGEGLDLDSASLAPSIGITARNWTWDLAQPHSAEGVVAVRVVDGSSVATGGSGDESVLLTGFLASDGTSQTAHIGVVRTSSGGTPYWAINSSTLGGGGGGGGPCTQLPVNLGAAATYGVLAGSTVTNTGLTAVWGDLGVSPGTAVTGFPPGTITGATHAGDSSSATAIGDLTTAYNDAAGRTLCPVSVAGNLGGQTLAPGLYKSTSSLAISSGDLTLDAGGNPNAVWIFQMASTLTTTSGRQVILAGGARASNIFWQVGSSATLGTTSVFKGTIMADQAVTLETGATLDGRALARIAAVTLDSNVVKVPALSGGSGGSVVLDLLNVDMTDGTALIRFQLKNGMFHAWVLEVDHAWRGWLDLGALPWGLTTGTASWRIGDIGSHPGSQHAVVDWAGLLVKWMTPGDPTYSAGNINLNQDENTRAVFAFSGPQFAMRSVTYIYDTVPPVGTFAINSNVGFSTSVVVNLTLSATDRYGVAEYAASESLSFPEGFHPYTTSATLFLTPEDGRHVVWVKFKDRSGVVSAPINQSVFLDQVNPTGAIYLANRSAYSNSPTVNLTILAFDAGGVDGAWVSNAADLSGATFVDLKDAGVALPAVSKTLPWTLAAGDGSKTVYAQVSDIHTRTSGQPLYNDSILVDTTAPSVTATLPGGIPRGGTTYLNTSRAVVHVEASDASGVSRVDISEDPTFASNVSYTGPGDLTYDLLDRSGPRTLYVRALDIYGLVSAQSRLDFFVDVNAPTGSLTIESGAEVVKARSVHLQINATDNVGVADMMLSTSLYFPGATWQPFSSTATVDLSPGDGAGKTVYVRFRDVNGRVSQAFFDTISMDTTAPTGFIIINNGDLVTTDRNLNLALQAYDNFAGQLEVRLSLSATFNDSTWVPFTDTVRFDARTNDGNVTVYYQIRDANGWESILYSDSIRVRPPTCGETNTCTPLSQPGFDAAYAAVALGVVAVAAFVARRRRTD